MRKKQLNRNTKGLKPFVKGQSGNPGGRPRYGEISKAIRFILDLPDIRNFVPQSVAEVIALGQIVDAIKRNRGSVEFVANRAEGTPTATIKSSVDLTGSQTIIDIIKPPSGESV